MVGTQICFAEPGQPRTDKAPGSTSAAPSSWTGTYTFYDDSGPTAGGSSTLVERTITVQKKGDKVTGTFASEGFQSYEKILCDTTIDANKLTLLFRSYPDGSLKNAYGVQLYKKGAQLLTLEKTIVKGKTKLLTIWREFKPNDVKAKSGTVCFTLKK